MPLHRRCRTTGSRRAGLRALAALLGGLVLGAATARAAVLVVGPPGAGQTFAQAVQQARDGDTIDVLPGHYRGDVAVITQRRLTIRGRGERPVFDASGRHAEGKATWVLRDGDITIENIAFRGARVPDHNGAGLRFERGRLLVRRCEFIDNENGILTGNDASAELRIEDSVFAQAPRVAERLHHLIYVGRIANFSLRGSRLSNGFHAHLVKSRARTTVLADNLIVDGRDGAASYEVDLPNGGDATLTGNVIHQGAGTTNPVLVAYGAEGDAWPTSVLRMDRNTLVSDAPGARFVRVWAERLPSTHAVQLEGNLAVGDGRLEAGAAARLRRDVQLPRDALPDAASGDYRPPPAARGAGAPRR